MKIPIHFVIGDTEGHDKLVGKYACRVNVPYICRYCDCHINYIDNVYTKFKLTLASTIARLSSSRKYEELKSMSYHCIDNAFTGLTFSDPHLGINGCVLSEVLHIMKRPYVRLFWELIKHRCANHSSEYSSSSEDRWVEDGSHFLYISETVECDE